MYLCTFDTPNSSPWGFYANRAYPEGLNTSRCQLWQDACISDTRVSMENSALQWKQGTEGDVEECQRAQEGCKGHCVPGKEGEIPHSSATKWCFTCVQGIHHFVMRMCGLYWHIDSPAVIAPPATLTCNWSHWSTDKAIYRFTAVLGGKMIQEQGLCRWLVR